MTAFWKAADTVWAIREETLRTIIDVASRNNESPEAVAKRMGRPLENSYRVEVRDGVAVIPVTGPLFRYANLFTAISGATSYELLARDFTRAVEDQSVNAIILDMDSPGGEVNGCQELADMIYAARGTKPIIAYVGGMAASGGYWIASAADEIVTAETGVLGSIGVMATYIDDRQRMADNGLSEITIISSQSPDKNSPPYEDRGHSLIQTRVDDLAAVFVSRVARNRGVDQAVVLSSYGQGDVYVGQRALDAGMADRFGTLETIIDEFSETGDAVSGLFPIAAAGGDTQPTAGGIDMTKPVSNPNNDTGTAQTDMPDITAEYIRTHHPDVAATLIDEGRAHGEREAARRMTAIMQLDESKGREPMAAQLAATGISVEQAAAVLASAPVAAQLSSTPFEAAMDQVSNPDVGTDASADGDSTLQSILATGQQLGLVARK